MMYGDPDAYDPTVFWRPSWEESDEYDSDDYDPGGGIERDDFDSDDYEDTEEKQPPKQRYLNHGLHYALETGRSDTVKMFLEYGADPNSELTTKRGLRPIEVAAINNDSVSFECLIQNGADPRSILKKLVETHWAIAPQLCKFFVKQPETFRRVILNAFSDEELNDEFESEIRGVALGLIELDGKGELDESGFELLESVIGLNCFKVSYDSFGLLIPAAIHSKSLRCLKLLLDRVTRIDRLHDCNGQFTDLPPPDVVYSLPTSELDLDFLPLSAASARDDLEIVMFLIERGEMCTESGDGLLPVDYAYKELATNVLRFFLLNGYTSKLIEDNQLHVACFLEDVLLVRKLIRGGADVNKLDSQDRVPLVVAIKMKNVNIVKLLLEAGANPEQCRSLSCFSCCPATGPKRHLCALVTAAADGNAKVLNAILEHRPGKINLNGWRHKLLLEAIEANNLETFTILFEFRVDYFQSRKGVFPLHLASATGNYLILQQLVEIDADPIHASANPLAKCKDPNCIQLLLKHGMKDNRKQLSDRKELSKACQTALKEAGGDVEIVKAYHKAGVNLAEDFSIFNQACDMGYQDVIKYLLSQNPDLKTECHRLKFNYLKLNSFSTTIQLLLDQGCTFDICQDFRYNDPSDGVGASCSYFQFFVLTKIVQESCGQARDVQVVRMALLSKLMWLRDLPMVILLRDCGIKVLTDKTFSEKRIQKKLEKDGADAEFLRAAEQICQEPISLQNQCRIAIRRELFSVKHHDRHILDAIEELPLPICLKELLSFRGQHEFEYLGYCSL